METEAVRKKGEIIFREGDVSNNTYIIKSGYVEISKGKDDQKVVLAVLKEGDVFGEMGLIEEKPRSATATALEDTRMAVIDHDTFNDLFLKNPASLIPFFKAVFERLRTTNQMLLQKAHTAPPETQPGGVTPPARGGAVVKIVLSGVSEAAKKALGNTTMTITRFPFKVGRVSSHASDVLSSNDLCLHDNNPYSVSRNHFSINLTDNKVYITDRGSTLGTIVNGKKISGETPILLDKPNNLVIAGGPQSPFSSKSKCSDNSSSVYAVMMVGQTPRLPSSVCCFCDSQPSGSRAAGTNSVCPCPFNSNLNIFVRTGRKRPHGKKGLFSYTRMGTSRKQV